MESKRNKTFILWRWPWVIGQIALLSGLLAMDPWLYPRLETLCEKIVSSGVWEFAEEFGTLYATFLIAYMIYIARRDLRRWVAPLIIAALLSGGLTAVLKPVIARSRPEPAQGQNVFQRPFYDQSHSMPSGHSTTAMTNAYMLGMVFPQTRPVAYTLGTLTGLSRVKKNKHFPADVFFGFLVAIHISELVVRIFEVRVWNQPRSATPVKNDQSTG